MIRLFIRLVFAFLRPFHDAMHEEMDEAAAGDGDAARVIGFRHKQDEDEEDDDETEEPC